MAGDLEDLKRRLVVGRKRGGRCIYDEAAKSELVEMCRQPGASVSRLARECAINANQVSRWLREHAHRHKRSLLARRPGFRGAHRSRTASDKSPGGSWVAPTSSRTIRAVMASIAFIERDKAIPVPDILRL